MAQQSEHPAQDEDNQDGQIGYGVNPALSVVGIGASAGGLRALQTLFDALPADTGMTFVVVTHLSPEHESVLPELLQAHTEMPVRQVTERVKMTPNHVYVIPPGKRLVVMEGHLDLAEFDMPRGARLQIDTFFRSLGEHHGDGAAIILSGTGSDGAVGMQTIKEKGGLLLVQAPEEAEYDGMPRSAIATGLVDYVGPVAELASQLVGAKRTRSILQLPQEPGELSEAGQHTLTQILTQLRIQTGHNFGGYKRPTLLRRIARRMQIVHLDTLSAYLHRLRQDSDEVDALYRDLLIHVTEFFRDAEAWAALATEVIPDIFKGKSKNDTIRIWIVGCATGEEAYSMAIVLLEHAATLPAPPQIQIFASDLGKVALDFARSGYYPEAIAANVSEERLTRFFAKDNSHYQVRAEVRECVLFTPHNLLQDPPFSKLDLISCRNLLIYLQRELQERIFESFHYGLRTEGYLFLGNAESAEGITELFEVMNKRQRIYRRGMLSENTIILPSLPMYARGERLRAPVNVRTDTEPRTKGEMHLRMLEEVGPPSLLVDEHHQVLNLSTSVGRYLLPPGGAPTTDAIRLVRPELQADLRSALFRAFEEEQATMTRPVAVRFNGAAHPVSMLVRPKSEYKQALVVFLENETPLGDSVGSGQVIFEGDPSLQQLEMELDRTQQRLQSKNEEYETTVEELRAANEELQSTNEEYKSTLEELETSKEELQSINEELHTINQEMKNKVDEISQAHSDLQNLLVATEIATLFLDRNLLVKRYTPSAADLFNLMPPDTGRPITHLRSNLLYEELEADARSVLDRLTPIVREVRSLEGHWYLASIRPYRTLENQITGVVMTFVDITANKENEIALRDSEERYRLLMQNVVEYAIFVLDTDGHIASWNTGAERIFGYTRAEAIGERGAMLFTEEEQTSGEVEAEMAMAREQGQASQERWHVRKDGSRFWGTGVLAALYHADGSLRGFAKVMRDNTERKEAEDRLLASNEMLEAHVEERTRQVRALAATVTLSEQEERRRISQMLHDDLQQLLYGIQIRLVSIQENAGSGERDLLARYAQEAYEWIGDAIRSTRRLTVDLRPPVLKDEGLADALAWLATQMQEVHGLEVEIQTVDAFHCANEGTRVLLFQSIRELLFNVVKHAGVKHALVTLREVDDRREIIVSDEGNGFDVAATDTQNAGGFGLYSVGERLRLFGGQMKIESTPGVGTRIILHVPDESPAVPGDEPI